MKAALIVFDDMTSLDFVGFYDPLTRLSSMALLPGFEWDICGRQESVIDDRGLRMGVDVQGQSLAGYDLLFVPGGNGTRRLQYDAPFLDWLRTFDVTKLKVSVCTGSLLLGAAGYLKGLRATTHPTALNELERYCSAVVRARIVEEGHVITGAGVSASLDLGLHVVERLAGSDARERIAQQMDYPYRWNP